MIGCQEDILAPLVKSHYKNDSFDIGVGIATGEALVIKAGIGYDKNNRDLVWIGDSPNKGAKLSDEARNPHGIYICHNTHSKLLDENKNIVKDGIKKSKWIKATMKFGDKNINVYKSSYYKHV
jgi:class 3 adenylate cyclase